MSKAKPASRPLSVEDVDALVKMYREWKNTVDFLDLLRKEPGGIKAALTPTDMASATGLRIRLCEELRRARPQLEGMGLDTAPIRPVIENPLPSRDDLLAGLRFVEDLAEHVLSGNGRVAVSCSVKGDGPGGELMEGGTVTVNGRVVRELTGNALNVVEAMRAAWPKRLTLDKLRHKSGDGSPARTLKRLRDRDCWRDVLLFPESRGDGFGLL